MATTYAKDMFVMQEGFFGSPASHEHLLPPPKKKRERITKVIRKPKREVLETPTFNKKLGVFNLFRR